MFSSAGLPSASVTLSALAFLALLAPAPAAAQPIGQLDRRVYIPTAHFCQSGLFWSASHDACRKCPKHVKRCSSATHATKCKTGYYLAKHKCVRASHCPRGTKANKKLGECIKHSAHHTSSTTATLTATAEASTASSETTTPTATKVFNPSGIVIKATATTTADDVASTDP